MMKYKHTNLYSLIQILGEKSCQCISKRKQLVIIYRSMAYQCSINLRVKRLSNITDTKPINDHWSHDQLLWEIFHPFGTPSKHYRKVFVPIFLRAIFTQDELRNHVQKYLKNIVNFYFSFCLRVSMIISFVIHLRHNTEFFPLSKQHFM